MSFVKDPPDLRSAVRNLCRAVTPEIQASVQAEQLLSRVEIRQETNISSVSQNQGIVSWSAHHSLRTVPTLDIARLFDFVTRRIKQTGAYAECKATLAAHSSDKNAERADFLVQQFSVRLVQNLIEDPSGNSVDRLCDVFLADVDEVPIWFSVVCGLTGVWVEGGSLHFSRYGLRRVSAEDIQVMLDSPFPNKLGAPMMMVPPTILEFNIKAPEGYLAQKETGFLTSVLLLAGHGSVRNVLTTLQAETIFRPLGGFGGPSWTSGARYNYAISEQNASTLETLVSILRPSFESDKPSDSLKAILRAFQRYQTAVTTPNDTPSIIALCISTLEALFLRGKERAELSNRLSNRVAIFLRECGENPIQLRKLIRRAYDIRSTFIHGDDMESETSAEMEKICNEVSDVAREVVLLMLQIHGEISKDDLISRLDNALLDEKAAGKLRELLNGKVRGLTKPKWA